jgi:hypothetical protein
MLGNVILHGENLKMSPTNNTTLKAAIEAAASSGNADTVDGYHLWCGTQAQYDAIAPKNSSTQYSIYES